MATGDEIQLLADGPFIRPKAVEPLGIYNGSTCWGLWVHGRPSRNLKRRAKMLAGKKKGGKKKSNCLPCG